MNMHKLQRYFGHSSRGAISEGIEALQDRLSRLRDMLPDAPLQQARDLMPAGRWKREYTLPAALAVGGVAIVGAIVVTALVMSDGGRNTPKRKGRKA